jgi:hypothetical protein
MKVYNQFTDKFGNNYSFDNYMDFSKFWFNLSRKVALNQFPTNFAELQKAAANSKEARKPFKIPNITEALRQEFLKGELTITEVAEELFEANNIPYVCEELAKKLININN